LARPRVVPFPLSVIYLCMRCYFSQFFFFVPQAFLEFRISPGLCEHTLALRLVGYELLTASVFLRIQSLEVRFGLSIVPMVIAISLLSFLAISLARFRDSFRSLPDLFSYLISSLYAGLSQNCGCMFSLLCLGCVSAWSPFSQFVVYWQILLLSGFGAVRSILLCCLTFSTSA